MSVAWPSNGREAVLTYIRYAVAVVTELEISFPAGKPNPVEVAQRYLAGHLSDEEFKRARIPWWDDLDAGGRMRDFQSREALLARLALCLVGSTPQDAATLDDALGWFLQVLDGLGVGTALAESMMASHLGAR